MKNIFYIINIDLYSNEQILASEKDSEIFFEAITNSPKANKNLINAANEYKALLA